MINYTSYRDKYIVSLTVPTGTQVITYEVIMYGSTVFYGQMNYGGTGKFELDCSDWIESWIAAQTNDVTSCSLTVNVRFDGGSTQARTVTWTPSILTMLPISHAQDKYGELYLINSGFRLYANTAMKIPLMVENESLKGKTIDNLEKVTYTDKFGNKHNASSRNRYEIECYVDPDWLATATNKDVDYAGVMLACQGALRAVLTVQDIKISGMYLTSNNVQLNGRVKDIERVETRSRYTSSTPLPTYKITFEVYN